MTLKEKLLEEAGDSNGHGNSYFFYNRQRERINIKNYEKSILRNFRN